MNVKSFETVEEMADMVDAISIVTPTSVHYELASKFIDAGKHCFIEKPMTSTVEEAEDICRRAKNRNVMVQVGHIERFNPAVLALSNHELEAHVH